MARRIHAWLRPGNGLGPQVFYRSLPAPGASANGLPCPLPGETRASYQVVSSQRLANLQIILPLIDEQMIADAAWRYWLGQLASTSQSLPRREYMPVALDSTAFNAPESLRDKNFIRPARPNAAGPLNDEAKEAIARSLLKQLTEAMCRLILGTGCVAQDMAKPPGDRQQESAPKVRIFLSHAKVDGTPAARKIRDYIYSQTQLAAFYDENDIPFGSTFRRVLEKNIQGDETAAMIAVRSARYATRPWCRRELSLFRKPLPLDPSNPNSAQWQVHPVLAVEVLEGGERTVGIPELGNSPLVRWAETVPQQEEQIVTMLLRDAMLAGFHSTVGEKIGAVPGRIVINWLPDAITLQQIPAVRNMANGEVQVVYPGRGLSGLELDILWESFPHVVFCSFEEFTS